MKHKQEIMDEIMEAFGDVPFPDHCGIHAAIAMDDWIDDPEVLAKITREQDVKGKWWEIPESEFEFISLALCYFDAKATEFYLPAFMMIAVKNPSYRNNKNLLIWLEPCRNKGDYDLYAHFKEKFSRISGKKKQSCITVLKYIRENLDPIDILTSQEDVDAILSHEFWGQQM